MKNSNTLQNDIQNFLTIEQKAELEKILSHLPKHSKPYMVGGCVRDIVMNIKPQDFDIEIYNLNTQEFEVCMNKLKANGVGKAFFVYKFGSFDISLPRSESKNGIGHRAFSVEIETDMQKACKRRDFTINSMMLDLDNNSILDFYGGIKDIKNKLIRAVDFTTFQDDSLRVLRAVQFSARFGFRIELETINVCNKLDISDLSKDRIRVEFDKLLTAKNQHFGLFYLLKTGVFYKLYNIQLSTIEFIRISHTLQHAVKFFEQSKSGLLFYIVSSITKTPISKLNLKSGYSIYANSLTKSQKRIPTIITDRFLVGVSTKIPIKEWLGSFKSGVYNKSQHLNVWGNIFKSNVTITNANMLNLSGKHIGKFLRKSRSDEIRKLFNGKIHYNY